MTRTDGPPGRPEGLPLAELFTRYLRRQADAHAEGLGYPEAAEVVPFETVAAQPVDPRLAWAGAVEAARHFAVPPASWAVPPEWPALVASQEPALAFAFSLGNYPQLVRHLQPLLAGGDPAALRAAAPRPAEAPGLAEWAAGVGHGPPLLLAAGVLRLARRFDEAADLLARAADLSGPWQPVRANEEAALLWHRGEAEAGLARWQAQEPAVPVLFNRGMAALFLGGPAEARAPLAQAAERLPETSAWHHLAGLYRALAEARG
jgi:hypothetical protein